MIEPDPYAIAFFGREIHAVVVACINGAWVSPDIQRVIPIQGEDPDLDATLSLRASARGRAWARTLRDTIEELLAEVGEAPIERLGWSPDLMRYSDEAIAEEANRRKLL